MSHSLPNTPSTSPSQGRTIGESPQAREAETTSVTVVVPVFNERECVSSLMTTLVELDAELADTFDFQFLFVDDGSTDGTAPALTEAIMNRPNYRVVPHQRNRGIAAAIHTGIEHATSEIVVSIDADGSYDARLVERMVPLLTAEIDMVTASPYHPEGDVEDVSAWRLWLSQRASGLYRLALRQKLYCYTSCFRVYRRSKVLDLEPINTGYVGVAELLWRLDRQGSKIVECPAVLRSRVAGQSKMRVFRATMRHLSLISQIWRDRFFFRTQRRPV